LRSASEPESVALRRRLLQAAGPTLATHIRAPSPSVGRVLLIRPDHIGDVLLSSPAVGALREGLPRARLTYLVGPWSADVARRGPHVDAIDTLAFPGFARRPKASILQPYALLLWAAARLRSQRYDMAVVLRPDHWWGALLALAAGVPVRVGACTPETEPLLSHTCDLDAEQHAVGWALSIAHLALRVANASTHAINPTLSFDLTSDARARAAGLWLQLGLGERRVIALQPSAGATLKRWPIARWAALGDRLTELGTGVLLIGAADDEALLRAIAAEMHHPAPIATGQPLEVSAAIYERCVLLIGPDGGGAHLAATIGTPTLRLYGPASPVVFGPWPAQADQQVLITSSLACTPCGHLVDPPCGARSQPACMLALSVDEVFESARRLLARG
jgi:heptosyltransferase III